MEPKMVAFALFSGPPKTWLLMTGASFTSATDTVKACVEKLPSAEVARTTMLWEAAASASSAPATVTTPVLALIAKRPPASTSRL